MGLRRTEMARVLALGTELSDREQALVRVVAGLRLATHAQLACLVPVGGTDASAESAARSARRILARLTESGVLGRLERRIGGVRAGSAGYVYYLGPVGQRLLAYWEGKGAVRGRARPEPGERFVRHRLAVSELYVQAQALHREGALELVSFDVEPDCWRPYLDRRGHRAVLKPDALLHTRARAREDRVFLEVDLATESRPIIARKLRRYVAYFQDGASGPTEDAAVTQVLLLTTTLARQAVLMEVCAALPRDAQSWFTVSTLDRGLAVLPSRVAG